MQAERQNHRTQSRQDIGQDLVLIAVCCSSSSFFALHSGICQIRCVMVDDRITHLLLTSHFLDLTFLAQRSVTVTLASLPFFSVQSRLLLHYTDEDTMKLNHEHHITSVTPLDFVIRFLKCVKRVCLRSAYVDIRRQLT